MNEIHLCLSLLGLIWLWSQWQKVSLDECRDNLFDLRQEVRTYFLQRGLPLDHPLYSNLRDLINGYIRFTESLNLLVLIRLLFHMPDLRPLKKQFQAIVRYEADPEHTELVQKVRNESGALLGIYLIESNLILLFVFTGLTLFFGFTALISRGWRSLSDLRLEMGKRVLHPFDTAARLEKLSFTKGLQHA
jgi:hypothetical protein